MKIISKSVKDNFVKNCSFIDQIKDCPNSIQSYKDCHFASQINIAKSLIQRNIGSRSWSKSFYSCYVLVLVYSTYFEKNQRSLLGGIQRGYPILGGRFMKIGYH